MNTMMLKRLPLLVFLLSWVLAWAATTPEIPTGQIIIDPDHPQWLKRQGGDPFYICGPGDPEGFLYLGERLPDGTRNGPQEAMIRKLIEYGGNCIYMQIVRTHGGDAAKEEDSETQNPFIDSDPAKGIDEDILNQWEQWFTLMDENNIVIYLFIYDDSARVWATGDDLGPEETAFVTELVNKFRHHRNLIWIFCEESEEAYSATRVQEVAQLIQSLDQPGRVIGNHHHSGTVFKTWEAGGALTHYSMQLSAKGDEAHQGSIEALKNAAGRYQVVYSESTAVGEDPTDMRHHMWNVAMGGLMPMALLMDIQNTPVSLLKQCRILQSCFEALPFYLMESHDELATNAGQWVFARPGLAYLIYSRDGDGPLSLTDLPYGNYQLTWLDCVTGRRIVETVNLDDQPPGLFRAPEGIGSERALSLLRIDVDIEDFEGSLAVGRGSGESRSPSKNQAPQIQNLTVDAKSGERTFIQLRFQDEGPGPYSFKILSQPAHGSLEGENNDQYYTPIPGFSGIDRFSWSVNDGQVDSDTATVTIRVTE